MNQVLTEGPSQQASVLPTIHKWLPILSFLISVVALTIRPEFREMTKGLFAALGGLLKGLPVVPARPDPSYDPKLARLLHGVQAGTILVFVLIHRTWLHQVASKLTDAMPIAKETLKQFTSGWLYMWYGWLALYVWFFAAAAVGANGSPRVDTVSDILNVLSGFAIWWCFLVLDLPSVNIAGQPHRDRNFRRSVWITAVTGLLCALLGAADRLFDLNHVGVVVGLYNALAIAFLTGRLGSHFMKIPRMILLFLYLYSMLQVFYSFLPLLRAAIWTPLVFLLALVLKIAVAYAGYDMMLRRGLERYLLAAQSGELNPA